MIKLYKHQEEVLDKTKQLNKVGYFLDMGLGKSYVALSKLIELNANINLIVCQKSMIETWKNLLLEHDCYVWNLTNRKEFNEFIDDCLLDSHDFVSVGIINYDLIFRRKELLDISNFTIILDESSEIQNESTKRCKFISKLNFKNVILLSGTICNGKYEHLISQMKLLGWNISKDLFYRQYIEVDYSQGVPIIKGYKNVERLKRKMRDYGCVFLKTEEVLELPEQRFIPIQIESTKEYETFKNKRIVTMEDEILVGDTSLTQLLYERMLCGSYNEFKLIALRDIIESTENRLIIFYNFNKELDKIKSICEELQRPISVICGSEKNLNAYESYENSITIIQYQSGSKGLNLQKANVIVYFTPTLSSENYMQSQKRIHRINQKNTCLYYSLVCKNSVEEKIYDTLKRGIDYTDELFKKDILWKI